MDAGIGVSHCGLTFMRGKFAHSGFPEMRFEHFSSMLLNKGFKVARVEQTETQEKCKERVKASLDWQGKKKPLDKFTKQTRREVCRVETPGEYFLLVVIYLYCTAPMLSDRAKLSFLIPFVSPPCKPDVQ